MATDNKGMFPTVINHINNIQCFKNSILVDYGMDQQYLPISLKPHLVYTNKYTIIRVFLFSDTAKLT